jgi:uncharacterized protein with gpF-like domain
VEYDEAFWTAVVEAGPPLWVPGVEHAFAFDAWLPRRLRVFTDLVRAEGSLYRAVLALLDRWAQKLRAAVLGPGRTIDPVGVMTTQQWFDREVDQVVEIEVREIFDFAAHDLSDEDPDALVRVKQHIAESRNRLARVPDAVYANVRGATMKATTEGWSIDELADRVDGILAEAGAERWRNRARVIARTEAIGAYNAGTFSGFLSYAKQLGGDWEKVWLATHDHRTRRTHARETGADGQRVGLHEHFKVGEGLLMYPGDPSGPPEEVIQCRCSILLARAGEIIDFSNRHFKGGA